MGGFESIFRPDLFRDQVILVTGGGSGIGRCTAHELAALGATVVIAGRRREMLEKTAAEIAESGGRADLFELDIRDEERVNAVFEALLSRHGRLDGLFNNAGAAFISPAADMKPKGFRAVVDINLNGTFIMCRAAYNHTMKEHGGVIVNMSADADTGMPLIVHSSACSAGIENLTRTLALEWCTAGVRVNVVAPGPILSSGLVVHSREIQEQGIALIKDIPAGRYGTESEVSAAAAFLLSPAAAYITGEKIIIAGGSQLQKVRRVSVGGEPRTKPFNGFHRSPDLAGSVFEGMME